MTPEQFVYWLSGYLSDKKYEIDSAILEHMLKQVRITQDSGDIVPCWTESSQ